MSRNGAIPVLEIGGTHVTAALVDPNGSGVLPGRSYRASLTPMGTAEEIIAELARVAAKQVFLLSAVNNYLWLFAEFSIYESIS